MFDTALPLSQVELDRSHPDGVAPCARVYPEPGATLLNVWVFDSVGSVSSSSWNVAGERPPPVANEKSCGSCGVLAASTTRFPRLRLLNVQVTVSFEDTSMLVIGLPSLQVALVRSHPEGTD